MMKHACLIPVVLLTIFWSMQVAVAQEPIELLLFDGRVVDDLGQPIANAQVQFWQTDLDGYYDHPAAPNTALRDLTFQFYGTATTDENGDFTFRTLRPGLYPGRPGHIHFKIWIDGAERLTSQLYFADEEAGQPASLTLDLVETLAADGTLAMATNKTIVLNMGNGGNEPITPSQAEGPFYPVVDFLDYDNDLTTLGETPTAVGYATDTADTTIPYPIIAVSLLLLGICLYNIIRHKTTAAH